MSDKIVVEFHVYEDGTEDNTELSFRTDREMHLTTLHRFCKAFAYTLGFTDESIEKCFGPDREEL